MVNKTAPTSDSGSISDRTVPRKHAVSRRRRRVFVAIAVIAGMTVGIGSGEIAMRIFDIHPVRFSPPKQLVFYDGSFHDMRLDQERAMKRRSRFVEVEMGEYMPNAKFKVQYATNPRGNRFKPRRIFAASLRSSQRGDARLQHT